MRANNMNSIRRLLDRAAAQFPLQREVLPASCLEGVKQHRFPSAIRLEFMEHAQPELALNAHSGFCKIFPSFEEVSGHCCVHQSSS